MADPEVELKELRKSVAERRNAFDQFFASERESLWKYCRRLTGSVWSAEDLVQETLIRAFGGLSTRWVPTSPKGYLFRIATRLWIDQQSRGELDTLELRESDVVAEPLGDLNEPGIAAMEHLVSVLPPRQRVVFLLTQAFEFTAAEVAEMLGMTQGAVKAALHRARTALSAPPETLSKPEPVPEVLTAFVEAFNRRDLEGICRLFHEDVEMDIVGAGLERGRDQLKNSSVKYTLEDEDANLAKVAWIEEEFVVLLLRQRPEEGDSLSEVVRVVESDGQIRSLASYYFCPQVLEAVAQEIEVPARTHGYCFAESNQQ